jgi:two-component system chemotaxis response regulator CheV
MPLMDGHRLTKLIKTDSVLKDVPVAIFSSLITPEMHRKGQQLGADIQMSKPEIGKLVGELDKLMLK